MHPGNQHVVLGPKKACQPGRQSSAGVRDRLAEPRPPLRWPLRSQTPLSIAGNQGSFAPSQSLSKGSPDIKFLAGTVERTASKWQQKISHHSDLFWHHSSPPPISWVDSEKCQALRLSLEIMHADSWNLKGLLPTALSKYWACSPNALHRGLGNSFLGAEVGKIKDPYE